MPIRKSSNSGIPYGGNSERPGSPEVGQPFFNGDAARLELYTSSTGWQNIVQETPAVVNIAGTYYEGNETNTLTINGTNFAVGATAYAVGSNGIEIQALTTSLISVVEISATFSGLSKLYEPYDIKVVNPSNLYGILYESVQVDDMPTWILQSGTLGTFIEEEPMSISTGALDDENQTIQYSVSSGSLPGGLSINASTGVISGTPSDIVPNTTYSFTLDAFDGNNHSYRNYSISITDRGPVWTTGQSLPTYTKNSSYSTTLVAVDDNLGAVSYSLVSGSLPSGLSLESSSGIISGIPTSSSHATFTIRATDPSGNYTDRQFTSLNVGPGFTQKTPPSYVVGSSYSYTIVATDDSGTAPTYSLNGTLPTGLSFNPLTGVISGTPTVSGESSTFSITATDANGTQTSSGDITIADFSLAYIPVSGFSEQTFSAGSYSTYTIPTTGSYELEVAGSSGGWPLELDSTYGGDGRVVTVKHNFFAGTVIKYAVGNYVENYGGNSANGGGIGGGGTFVYLPDQSNKLLVAAGGGGGGSINNGGSAPYWYGMPGQPLGSTSGSPARNGQAGGSNGGDGTNTNGNGTPARGWNYLIANNFPQQGSTGYHNNGFGGGGTSSDHAGGGGGGYSGGGTGQYSSNTGIGNSDGRNGGGGGGTYVVPSGYRSAVDSGLNPGQGYFKIRAATS